VNTEDALGEVLVYLASEGWRWKRVAADGKQVSCSDRSFDFRTEVFRDAQQSNPGIAVRKGTRALSNSGK
jgi:hypothetical protein